MAGIEQGDGLSFTAGFAERLAGDRPERQPQFLYQLRPVAGFPCPTTDARES